MDPGPQDLVLWRQSTNTHRLPSPVEEKGRRGHSLKESALTLALTGFYCFSGDIALRMILIYYAQVCFRLVTENKGEGVVNYIKEEGYLQM